MRWVIAQSCTGEEEMSLLMHISVGVDRFMKERSRDKSLSQTNVAGSFHNDLALKLQHRLMTLHLAWGAHGDFSQPVM